MWFIDPVTKERTDRCEMLLHAKDGELPGATCAACMSFVYQCVTWRTDRVKGGRWIFDAGSNCRQHKCAQKRKFSSARRQHPPIIAGIFLSEVPRQVDHIYLTSGNRGELLIKCSGEPGDEFILTTGGGGTGRMWGRREEEGGRDCHAA